MATAKLWAETQTWRCKGDAAFTCVRMHFRMRVYRGRRHPVLVSTIEYDQNDDVPVVHSIRMHS